MGLFRHTHKFEEVSRTYNQPYTGRVEGSAHSVNKAIHGFTVIEQKCSICGALDHIEVIGKTEKPV